MKPIDAFWCEKEVEEPVYSKEENPGQKTKE